MPRLPTLDTSNSGVSASQLREQSKALIPEIADMRDAAEEGYENDRCSINLPHDKKIAKDCAALAKRHRGADAIIVVGIGGSNLGTMAVQEAVLGRMHNIARAGPKIYYSDTVDAYAMKDLLKILSLMKRQGKTVVINGVSKSGGTTETIANFEILAEALRKSDRRADEHIVVTSDEGSAFWKLAQKRGYHTLSIPKRVGGRYSVMSAVGQYPLRAIGVDVESLLKGAADMRKACLGGDIGQNPATQRAALLHHHYLHGKSIADMFYFCPDLESAGKWYRQLMGESIGKEWDSRHKKQVFCGMTPTVSIGSTDLHSMAQLYLGGPQDKFTTFITIQEEAGSRRTGGSGGIRVPRDREYEALVPHIQGRRLSGIMDAISKGVATAYEKKGRPYCHMALHGKNEHQTGALLQMHMMEMMYLGRLLGVNPFDQPAVEAYKSETKRILAGK